MAVVTLLFLCLLPLPSSGLFFPSGVQTGPASVTATCGDTGMLVTVEVDASFSGKVYASGHEFDCEFSKLAGSALTFQRAFAYDSTECGQMLTTTGDNSREFAVTTIIRYNTGFLTREDKAHDSMCVFDDMESVDSNLGTVNGSEDNLQQNQTIADGSAFGLLNFTLQADSEGNMVDVGMADEIPLGKELTMRIEMDENALFDTLLVIGCVASNRADNSSGEYVELGLLDNTGCIMPNRTPVLPSEPKYSMGGNLFELVINAFMFIDGRMGNKNELHFACDVQLCPTDNPSLCTYGCGAFRKRRSADELSEENRVRVMGTLVSGGEFRTRRAAGSDRTSVGGGTTVVSDEGRLLGDDTVQKTPSTVDDCLNNPKVQAILVALGLLLLALLITIITLAILFCRRRRRGQKEKQVDDGLSMGSSTQKLTPDYFVKQQG